MVGDVVEGLEDLVREPIVAHKLPEIFLRVQFRAFGRQQDEREALTRCRTRNAIGLCGT